MYFTIGYSLKLRRAITIFILYKEGKADYLFLGSYRLITLKNTLSKILERVVVNRIADTAKKYTLLLQSQIEARKNHLTLSVLTLFTSTIKTAWAIQKDFIVLMLSLDISSAYNNIPYNYFLYILRIKGFLE